MKGGAGKALLASGAVLLALAGAALAASMLMGSRAAAPEPDPNGLADMGEAVAEGGFFVDWEYWHEVNPDVVGWIEMPGTSISQPIVQAPPDDPTRYLYRDVYGGWNLFGCPYVDAGCPYGLDSWSVVISGHNITYPPAMFHELELFHDEDYVRDHREVVIVTPEKTRRLMVLGANTIAGWDEAKRVTFASARDFWKYRNEALSQCDTFVAQEGELGFGQLVTLCSCSYRFTPQNERTLVYAA